MKYLLLISCFMFLTGATWDAERTRKPKALYENRGGVKWEKQPSDQAEVDQPDQGWFRDPSSFSVPGSWPEWAKRRFQRLSLANGNLEPFRKEMMWDRPSLDVNTKWTDAMADKNQGAIEVQIPSFHHFAFIVLDPPQGIVDQDFKGNAKIYGLDDTKQYRIVAFDSRGFLGMAVTAISDKYIRVYDESSLDPDFQSQYSHTKALHAVEDPNGAVWVASQDPLLSGAAYYFPNLTAYDQSGRRRWDYRPLMGYNAPDDWEAGLVHNRSDGSVVYATGRVPYIKPGYMYDAAAKVYRGYTLSDPAVGHIAKIAYSGQTTWQQDNARVAYKIIPNTSVTGWTFVGNDWTSGSYDFYGSMGQIDSSGVTKAWGNGEEFVTAANYKWWSVTESGDGDYIAAGRYENWSERSGTPSVDEFCAGAGVEALFDDDNMTAWYGDECCPDLGTQYDHYVEMDFGAGNSYALDRVAMTGSFEVIQTDGLGGVKAWTVAGSNNGADWTTLVSETDSEMWFSGTHVPSVYMDNTVKYRYYRLTVTMGCKRRGEFNHVDCDGDSCLVGAVSYWHEWYAYGMSFDEFEPYASLHKIEGTPGATEGDVLSSVSFQAGRQFYDVTANRDKSRIAAIGYSSGNSVFVVTTDNDLNTIQERTLTIGTEGRSIQPVESGGYVVSGTRIESGVTEMFVSKIGENLEPEWVEYFKEPGSYGAVGRYAIETRDEGFLAVGGSYPTESSSKVYVIKGDRFHRSCSHGTPCR